MPLPKKSIHLVVNVQTREDFEYLEKLKESIRNIYSIIKRTNYVDKTPWTDFILDLGKLIKINSDFEEILHLWLLYLNGKITLEEVINKMKKVIRKYESLKEKVEESKNYDENKNLKINKEQSIEHIEINKSNSNLENVKEIKDKSYQKIINNVQKEGNENIVTSKFTTNLINNDSINNLQHNFTSPNVPLYNFANSQLKFNYSNRSMIYGDEEEYDSFKRSKSNKKDEIDEWQARQLVHMAAEGYNILSKICENLGKKFGMKSLIEKAKEFNEKRKEWEEKFKQVEFYLSQKEN